MTAQATLDDTLKVLSSARVWRLVCGYPTGTRERRIFIVLQPIACIDDSGNEPTKPHFVLAGFVASAVNWAALADEWKAVLNEPPGLEYFKMSEAIRLEKQFAESKGWTEAKRDDLIITLVKTIRKYAGIRIHAKIAHADFDKYIRSIPAPYRTLVSDNPYVMLLQRLMVTMIARQHLFGVTEPCDFIFDKQAGFELLAHAAWSALKTTAEQSQRAGIPNLIGASPHFEDDKTFLPLQAADLYAGQMRNFFAQNMKLDVPPNRFLGQLLSIPVIGYDYEEADLAALRENLLDVNKIIAKENPHIRFVSIEETKPARRRARRRARRKTKIAGQKSSRSRK